jgi:hypothetical protein
MPRYQGMSREETNGAKTPREGVEVHVRLLFDDGEDGDDDKSSGAFFAMNKAGELTSQMMFHLEVRNMTRSPHAAHNMSLRCLYSGRTSRALRVEDCVVLFVQGLVGFLLYRALI